MFDGQDANGRSDMGYACTKATDQDDVLRPVLELAAVQLPDSSLVDLASGEVEAGEILLSREACGLHLPGSTCLVKGAAPV